MRRGSHKEYRRHEPQQPQSDRSSPGALTLAIERNDWERAALLLLISLTDAWPRLPVGTIDDVLALLDEEARYAR